MFTPGRCSDRPNSHDSGDIIDNIVGTILSMVILHMDLSIKAVSDSSLASCIYTHDTCLINAT